MHCYHKQRVPLVGMMSFYGPDYYSTRIDLSTTKGTLASGGRRQSIMVKTGFAFHEYGTGRCEAHYEVL